ncbi:Thivi_2564 family membrane protein [Legionella brunensis]|uniref:Uncharacterized protein n=1 Tax=Legionella brunensis TaxID=29422 RepID=A0A0W0SU00_9GAMM|nr:Thivi_2564 family membrane protein [Legionella brunensis]KTC86871.1 hypothetical protein Lbru_0100 [Legionella brunensis]
MLDLGQLIMVAICGFLLWVVNEITMHPLINWGLNCLLLVMIVIYIMQFLGVVKNVLPSIRLF